MAQVTITKVNDAGKKTLPVFEEMAKRMEAVRLRAFDLFEKRGRELGRELEDWFKAERELMGAPASELVEKNGAYELQITLPGFESKDIEVTALPSAIIVHAATQDQKKTEEGNVIRTEAGSNEVYRSFEVPALINVDKVTASFEKGVLRIEAPQVTTPIETKAMAA
jgi:HSP20 family protein